MESIGSKKFYGTSSTSTKRFRLQKPGGKPVARSLHPIGVVVGLDNKRKKCATTRRPRTKVPDEPEILTLSSDDEEKQEKKPDRESQLLSNGISSGLDAEAKAIEAETPEESDSCEDIKKQSEVIEGGGMLQQAIEGSIAPPYALIQCRTVRVGTYKAKPSERVVISSLGLELKLPLPTNGRDVVIRVPIAVIGKVLVSFCHSMPVLFIYLRTHGAKKVRELLQMTDPKGSYYFDPDSKDETLKRITLLPEKLSDEQKMAVKRIFEKTKKLMTEIGNSLANEILVKSSPCENMLRAKFGLPGAEVQTIMIYPPPPAKGGISINTEDYACLGEDQFLNDVIIDFYLKYLMQSVLSETDRERTHVFSSFFYKRLTSRPKSKGRKHPVEDDPKLTPAEKRHARVKGWTKNVNLFSKDFIIIPINENCHWFLAIICFPGQDGCLRMSDNTPIEIPKAPSTSAAAVAAAAAAAASTNAKLKVKDNVMSIGSTTITPVKAPPPATITLDHNGEDGSDRDEAEGDEEEMEENSSEDESQDSGNTNEGNNSSKASEAQAPSNEGLNPAAVPSTPTTKKSKPLLREAIKQPCILIFDSLVGAPRYRVAATLREYLSIEYKMKEKKDKEFNKDTIKGMLPKVPQQTNFTDCGLYLLQYVEMFFKDPIIDYHFPIKQLLQWFPEEIVSKKREEIVNLLHDLMKEQNKDPASLNLPQLTFSQNSAPQLNAQQLAEDEEARARLAEAEAEADEEERKIARRQLAVLQGIPYQIVKMEDVNCQTEEIVPQGICNMEEEDHSGNQNIPLTDNENISVQESFAPGHTSLVDYPDSSASESSCDNVIVKRVQSDENEEEDPVKKKMRAE